MNEHLFFWFVIKGFFCLLNFFKFFLSGHAARALGQSSRFGAMLDMVTDRMTTMALMMCLCQFYPGAFCWRFFLL